MSVTTTIEVPVVTTKTIPLGHNAAGQVDLSCFCFNIDPRLLIDTPPAPKACLKREPPVFRLMDLPLEIRLQIFQWTCLMHPLRYAQLAPWYPTPSYTTYPQELLRSEIDQANDVPAKTDLDGRRLLSPHRLVCSMPTALLRCSRQIYAETHLVPFQENEFVFVNWFSSGLWAARAFTRPLQPWQRGAMRQVRLEVLGRDFSGAGLKEWTALCDGWADGLRGLRLKILVGGGPVEPAVASTRLNGESAELQIADAFRDPEPRPAWIEEGLRRLRGLRALEVELSTLDWDNDRKRAWCASLGRMLNAEREKTGLGPVSVACVRRLSAPRKPAVAKEVAREVVCRRSLVEGGAGAAVAC